MSLEPAVDEVIDVSDSDSDDADSDDADSQPEHPTNQELIVISDDEPEPQQEPAIEPQYIVITDDELEPQPGPAIERQCIVISDDELESQQGREIEDVRSRSSPRRGHSVIAKRHQQKQVEPLFFPGSEEEQEEDLHDEDRADYVFRDDEDGGDGMSEDDEHEY
jgi:hypothetical protein